jgi:hypothetical protein
LIGERELVAYVQKAAAQYTAHLTKEADKLFEGRIKDAKSVADVKKLVEDGKVARCSFCSTGSEGTKCADKLAEATGAQVRGTNLKVEKAAGKCVVCGDVATKVVYVGRGY